MIIEELLLKETLQKFGLTHEKPGVTDLMLLPLSSAQRFGFDKQIKDWFLSYIYGIN
jgi:hypothetical protein